MTGLGFYVTSQVKRAPIAIHCRFTVPGNFQEVYTNLQLSLYCWPRYWEIHPLFSDRNFFMTWQIPRSNGIVSLRLRAFQLLSYLLCCPLPSLCGVIAELSGLERFLSRIKAGNHAPHSLSSLLVDVCGFRGLQKSVGHCGSCL